MCVYREPTPKLKPCPFCGSDNVETIIAVEEASYTWEDDWDLFYYVRCNSCDIVCGRFDEADEAIEAWNKRV